MRAASLRKLSPQLGARSEAAFDLSSISRLKPLRLPRSHLSCNPTTKGNCSMCFQCTMFSLSTTAISVARVPGLGYLATIDPFEVQDSRDHAFQTSQNEDPVRIAAQNFNDLLEVIRTHEATGAIPHIPDHLLLMPATPYRETSVPDSLREVNIYRSHGGFLVQMEYLTDANKKTAAEHAASDASDDESMMARHPEMYPALEVCANLRDLASLLAFTWGLSNVPQNATTEGMN